MFQYDIAARKAADLDRFFFERLRGTGLSALESYIELSKVSSHANRSPDVEINYLNNMDQHEHQHYRREQHVGREPEL